MNAVKLADVWARYNNVIIDGHPELQRIIHLPMRNATTHSPIPMRMREMKSRIHTSSLNTLNILITKSGVVCSSENGRNVVQKVHFAQVNLFLLDFVTVFQYK